MSDSEQQRGVAHFGVFELDFAATELRKSGRLVALSGQPVRVLMRLVWRVGEVVTRGTAERVLGRRRARGFRCGIVDGSVVIAGPDQFDAAAVTTFGGGTNRVSGRRSLTLRSIGMHFGPQFRAQLPATLTMVVRFRDDRGNITSADLFVQVT